MKCSTLVLFAGAILAVQAQPGAGNIHGHVTDPSGRSVPDARVAITGTRGKPRILKTDSQGEYHLRSIDPGTYQIRVEAPGFAAIQRAAYRVIGGADQPVDFSLSLATVTENIVVQDRTQVELDPSANASALVLRGKELEALSDDRDDLAADLAALAGPAAGPNGGQIFIDGFTGGRLPAKSSIREIRINQNPFSAEYDRIGMGRVEIFTKPGTQDFHGEIQTHDGSSIFNSRNPFTPVKAPWRRIGVEGEIGGPIGKKSSFLADFEVRTFKENSFVNARTLDSNLNVAAVSQGVVTPRRDTEDGIRFDRQLSPNHTLTARYNFARDSIDNQGASGYSLPSRIYDSRDSNDTAQLVETGIYGLHLINDTRARYTRQRARQEGNANQPTTVVLDAFTGGGSPLTRSFTNTDRIEVLNTTSLTHGAHLLRWGGRVRSIMLKDQDTQNYTGTFTFSSLDSYRLTLLGAQGSLTSKQIRDSGGGASQFTIAGGNPQASLTQHDAGFFLLDDWRARPNVTLSLGLRYEIQTNLSDYRNIAPRIAIAWGLGSKRGTPKTVFRAGAGIFFDRVNESLSLDSLRRDGFRQLQFVVQNPDFYPTVPSIAQLQGGLTPQAIRRLDGQMRAPEMLQTGVALERQLPRNMTAAINYIHSRGWHSLRSRNITAPLTTTSVKSTAIYLYEASGMLNQNQLITNLNARINRNWSFTGSYTLNKANSDTDGAGTFGSNQYDLHSEYGRAGFDVRHRVQLNGTISAPLGLRFSPFLVATSGRPFNITVGRDLNGDTIFNDRPAIATDLARVSVRQTPFGSFDLAPAVGQNLIPRNYGNGPGQVALNLRVARVFKLGEGGKGKKDPMEITVTALSRNLLNHPNLALPVGNLSSPVFGQSIGLISGGGGNNASGNRRIEFQLKLSF